MPEIKNSFVKGKMNQDLDERLIPKGEFRFAQNLSISESEDSDTGAVEIIKGTLPRTKIADILNHYDLRIPTPALFDGLPPPVVIGYADDVKNKRVAYFITNHYAGNDTDDIRSIRRAKGQGSNIVGGTAYSVNSNDNSAIVLYDFEAGTVNTLISGAWLNFSTQHLITGAKIMDDLLFWTDNYNQPRKINIQRCIDNPTHYEYEEQVSVAKYAPYAPIRLVNRNGYWAESNTAGADVYTDKTNGNITSKYLRDKFVRFSYRFKYEDGEYSLMAPFTQVVFEPLNNGEMSGVEDATLDNTVYPNQVEGNNNKLAVDLHSVWRTGKVNIMQNAINKAVLRIPMPNYNERSTATYTTGAYSNDFNIDEIEILVKESDSLAVKSLRSIKLEDTSNSDFDYYTIKPSSTSAPFNRQCFKYVYKSEEPIKVLPEDQLTRVYDQVPLQAKALEISGNRLIYGNFVENYDFPLDESGKKGIDYILGVDEKGDTEFGASHGLQQALHRQYIHHSVKQRRTYQVGIVFSDKYGRQSPVILSSSTENDADTVYTDPVTATHADKLIATSAQSNSGPLGNGISSSTIVLDAVYPIEVGMHAVGTGIGSNKVVFSHTTGVVSGSMRSIVVITGGPYTMTNVSIAFSQRSWSSNQIAYGQALKIIFNQSQLFSGNKQVYNPSQNANYNPHGWYSYKVVVKQTEQDYYNIYASHPYQGWDNIKNIQNNTTSGGKSWLPLSGDNINKVPRSLKETDFSRDGVMGSEEKLYPKVVPKTNDIDDYMGSHQQQQYHELTPVLTLGDAFEQGLYLSPEHSGDGTGGFQVYNWIFDRERNPLIAELPNIKNYMTAGGAGVYNSSVIIAYVVTTTTDSLTCDITSNSNVATIADPGDVDGYMVNGSNVSSKGTPLKVASTALSAPQRTVTFESKQSLKNGDMLVFSLPMEGLTVFETEPFKSKIDIFYESTTCGLVQDLNDELSDTSVTGGPSNIAMSATSFPESQNTGSIGTVSATDNTGSSNLNFDIVSAYDGNGSNKASKFTINSSTGVVELSGGFRFTDTAADLINLKVEVNDPDSGVVFETFDISVTNSNPTVTGNATTSVANNVGSGVTIHTDTNITNGSKLSSEDHINLSSSHVMGNTAYNGYFDTTLVDNTVTIRTTTNWTISNGVSFFADTAANRTMTVTITDSTGNPNGTATFTLVINETQVGTTGFLQLSNSYISPCEVCSPYPVTVYAIQHLGAQPPGQAADGELILYEGNKLFTDANLTTTVSDDYYLFSEDTGGGSFVWRCCIVGFQFDDGVVGSIINADDCDDPS